jgi:hypothetical protein
MMRLRLGWLAGLMKVAGTGGLLARLTLQPNPLRPIGFHWIPWAALAGYL